MRKVYTKGGGQHTICARIDNENWTWLQHEPNRNRIINQGLWWWKRMQNKSMFDNTEETLNHWEKCIKEETSY